MCLMERTSEVTYSNNVLPSPKTSVPTSNPLDSTDLSDSQEEGYETQPQAKHEIYQGQ